MEVTGDLRVNCLSEGKELSGVDRLGAERLQGKNMGPVTVDVSLQKFDFEVYKEGKEDSRKWGKQPRPNLHENVAKYTLKV